MKNLTMVLLGGVFAITAFATSFAFATDDSMNAQAFERTTGLHPEEAPFPNCVFRCGGWVCPPEDSLEQSKHLTQEQIQNARAFQMFLNSCL